MLSSLRSIIIGPAPPHLGNADGPKTVPGPGLYQAWALSDQGFAGLGSTALAAAGAAPAAVAGGWTAAVVVPRRLTAMHLRRKRVRSRPCRFCASASVEQAMPSGVVARRCPGRAAGTDAGCTPAVDGSAAGTAEDGMGAGVEGCDGACACACLVRNPPTSSPLSPRPPAPTPPTRMIATR